MIRLRDSPTLTSLWDKISSFWTTHPPFPLSAEHVRFSYGTKDILNNLNLTIHTTQIVAIVGKSGAGKSTFLNLAAGVLTRQHSGDIRILGEHAALMKEDLGYVPQHIALIPDMTIRENIIFFGLLYGLTPTEAIERATALMTSLQLDIPLTTYPHQISGGQRIRVNILVSILHDPKVIILDEPFVGLDYANRKLLWHFLEYKRNQKRTVLLTTHLLTEAEQFADHLVLLDKGKIVAKGTMKDVQKKLKVVMLLELKCRCSGRQQVLIERYCADHDIIMLDRFGSYTMFGIKHEKQKTFFMKYLDKHRIPHTQLSYREPNLDELFLKVQ